MLANALFITGRFRSGSTLLWNIFNEIPTCCAFYEPCHDLLITHIQQNTTPTSNHIGVNSYWDEYAPVLDTLKEYHRMEFGVNRLFLESDSQYDQLKTYIDFLTSSSNNRLPVLQFNRMDFRLPWLRNSFPKAKILHLYRNPRDQWFSMVRNLPQETWSDPFINTDFELMTWSCALSVAFPFLFSSTIKTSYHRHYILWRLSELMGKRQSDMSVSFENDVLANPQETIQKMTSMIEMGGGISKSLANLVKKPESGGWLRFKTEEWFDSAEKECEGLLDKLGLIQDFGIKPLAEIIANNENSWQEYGTEEFQISIREALKLFIISRRDCLNEKFNTKAAVEKLNNEYFLIKKRNKGALGCFRRMFKS